jgi:hypothetical protein
MGPNQEARVLRREPKGVAMNQSDRRKFLIFISAQVSLGAVAALLLLRLRRQRPI